MVHNYYNYFDYILILLFIIFKYIFEIFGVFEKIRGLSVFLADNLPLPSRFSSIRASFLRKNSVFR